MNRKEFTITTFAKHIGRTKQNIAQLIKQNKFSFTGYRLDLGEERTRIIKIDRRFFFHFDNPNVIIIVKEESPELAVLAANDLLFHQRITSFRFKMEDAREIEENEILISNLTT